MKKTFIIAELGSAWRFGKRQLDNVEEMVASVKESGADAVKFQFVSNPRKMELRRNVDRGAYGILCYADHWIYKIYNICISNDIEYMCSIFISEDVAILNPYVKRWKVASLECENDELIDAIEATGKPVIVSCGAMSFAMLPPLLNASTLHCTAGYPAPLEQLNLRAIKFYSGYSDHSCNVLTGSIAVACGAKIIEVHVRHKNTPKDNPDYKHSLTMKQFSQYVAAIRMTEVMLGDGVKKVEKCEEWALKHKVKA